MEVKDTCFWWIPQGRPNSVQISYKELNKCVIVWE